MEEEGCKWRRGEQMKMTEEKSEIMEMTGIVANSGR